MAQTTSNMTATIAVIVANTARAERAARVWIKARRRAVGTEIVMCEPCVSV
ncbi:hypothetical protein GCM10017620_26890 [Brevundimonas intermedia]|uniref:Glycosyltransferase family 2 protein n=1 Tax=Brevundimonas intermedia TaxID=74315 RepID=A0ABQ5TAR3_9CAUL|nr:hypothetical protein GCM10017620_26890 [Brevundimonas intermedia]